MPFFHILCCLIGVQGPLQTILPRIPCQLTSSFVWPMRGINAILKGGRRGEVMALPLSWIFIPLFLPCGGVSQGACDPSGSHLWPDFPTLAILAHATLSSSAVPVPC